jgi:formylglycine-generating enzyme required for sulfatase activity
MMAWLPYTITMANDQVLKNRLLPPDATAIAKAEKSVQEILGEEINKAKTPMDCKALAAKLLQMAKDPKEVPANRWVLYTLAREIAASSGAVALTVETIDQQELAFAITSRLGLTAEIAEKLAKTASLTGIGNKPILDFLYTTAEQAIEADDFEICVRMLNLGLDIAKWNSKETATTEKFVKRRTSVEELKKVFEKSKKDEVAKGKYLCFRKGDWAKGLPLLAKSKDEGLAAVAKRDWEKPTDANTKADLGDAWWELADKEKTADRIGMIRRSIHWYRLSLNDLSGLAKLKIEARIKKGSVEIAEDDAKNGTRGEDPSIGGDEAANKVGRLVEVELAKGVRMTFCWIPSGKAQLGSPKSEQDYVIRAFFKGKRPEFLDLESARGEFTTKGFWLGKYTVTQEQWKTVMGNNPSQFYKEGTGKDKVQGMNTSRFPVEQVSWDDCQHFLKKMNDVIAIPNTMGKGKFALPNEDEWEYACRGGKGNNQAYYFGNVLNGTHANCDGSLPPYGTTTKGPALRRTTEVGTYEKVAPHPWGLCDMSGNVWQWCQNKEMRVIRGGCCFDAARDCRSAAHDDEPPVRRGLYGVGFRVAVLGENVSKDAK